MQLNYNIGGERFTKDHIKSCRNCGSVYITQNACESCGIQFNYDPIGDPFSKKSFYAIQEKFLFNCYNVTPSFLERISLYRRSLKQSYFRALLRRYTLLLSFLSKESSWDRLDRNQYLLELFDLSKEWMAKGKNADLLWDQLEKIEDSPCYHVVAHMIISINQQNKKNKRKEKIKDFLSYRIAGVLKVSRFLTILCTFAILLYLTKPFLQNYFANR